MTSNGTSPDNRESFNSVGQHLHALNKYNAPKISIVTPSFNQASFLESTIQSILSQNYPNLEYVIIDGGSTDGSVEIIKKYEEHLHYWCSEPDEGQYHAINKGFAHTTGEVMAWLNSDDMYYPWTLRTVSSIMTEHPSVEWLTTLRPGFWDWNGFCTSFGECPGYSREAFLDGCYFPRWQKTSIRTLALFDTYIQQESTFWRRRLWQKIGGSLATEFGWAADFDLWARFYLHADLCGTISPLAGFRVQAAQRSRDRDKYVAEAEKSLSLMRETMEWSPGNLQLRMTSRKLRLWKVPKVRGYISRRLAYAGKKVVRRNGDQRDGFWEVLNYKFG